MAKKKPATATANDTVYLTESQKRGQRNKAQIGIRLQPEIIERLRNIVWATNLDGGINGIVEEATIAALERLEKKYQDANGEPVPVRPGALIGT